MQDLPDVWEVYPHAIVAITTLSLLPVVLKVDRSFSFISGCEPLLILSTSLNTWRSLGLGSSVKL